MNKDLLIAIRRKKVHESRFVNLVVTLSYYEVSWSYFRETLRFLSKAEFSDIIEERSSLNKCCYPICNAVIKIHPTATVSLDVKGRKIYNISQRKMFCSDWCYAAFKHINDQLPDDPTWKSDTIVSVDFTQYPKDGEGCKGEVYYEENKIDIGPIKTDQEKEEFKKAVKTINKQSEIDEKKIDKIQNVIKALDNLAITKNREKKSLEEVIAKVKEIDKKACQRKIIFIKDEPKLENKETIFVEKVEENINNNKVLKSIIEWITDDTRQFLLAKDADSSIDREEIEKGGDCGSVWEEKEKAMRMPLVDCIDQVAIRRSIILRRIQSCATPILADFGLNNNSFHLLLIKFMNTCKLSSSNIVFSAKEVKQLIVIMINILFNSNNNNNNTIIMKEDLINKYINIEYFNSLLNTINNCLYHNNNNKEEEDKEGGEESSVESQVTSQGDY